MVVAILVYIASYFGYVITEGEAIQEEKDVLLKESTYTFAPGALFRSEQNGGSSVTFSLGYEYHLSPLDRSWALHTNYRLASEARSIFDALGTFKQRDHYIQAGVMKYLNDKTALYIDAGPYWRRSDLKAAVTIGLSFSMTAFGAGFRPNFYYECVDDGECQYGLFANFEVF